MLEEYIEEWEKRAAELSGNPASTDIIRLIQVSESSQIIEMIEDLKERMEQENPMTDGFTGESIKPNMNKLRSGL